MTSPGPGGQPQEGRGPGGQPQEGRARVPHAEAEGLTPLYLGAITGPTAGKK